MEVKLQLKDWRMERKDDGMPKLVGNYQLMCGAKNIATQSFNNGYGSLDVGFSAIILSKLQEIDELIKEELELLLK